MDRLGKFGGSGKYTSVLSSTKDTITGHLQKMVWNPAGSRRELVMEKYRAALPGWHAKLIERKFAAHDARGKLRDDKAQAALQPFFKRQAEAWSKGAAEHAEQMEALYRALKDDDAIDLICRLKDEEPMARWMAILVIERRWERLENFLVDVLEDPAPPVRQAAHHALVKLTRGNDFGPSGINPSTADIRAAQKRWRNYLELQERDARPADLSER